MTSRVVALTGGGASVEVDAEVEIVGRLVQFGRGMIEEVSRQMFGQFSDCVRGRLEVASDDGESTPGATRGGGAEHAPRPLRIVPLVWSAAVARIRGLFRGERP